MRFFGNRRGNLARVNGDDERIVQLIGLHAADAVIDVGANVGQYAQRLRSARRLVHRGYSPGDAIGLGNEAHRHLPEQHQGRCQHGGPERAQSSTATSRSDHFLRPDSRSKPA